MTHGSGKTEDTGDHRSDTDPQVQPDAEVPPAGGAESDVETKAATGPDVETKAATGPDVETKAATGPDVDTTAAAGTEPGADTHPGAALLQAVAMMDRLRSPGGCPWDAEQTHRSLVPYAIEEAHEVAEAVESGDPDQLRDELGDLLLQVLFHARIAMEAPGGFDIDDVAGALIAKLTYRHPHVFADDGAQRLSAQQVTTQWEQLKSAERPRDSVLEGIPVALPALARATKMLDRIRGAGLEVDLEALVDPASNTETSSEQATVIGRQLLSLSMQAAAAGIDPEAALRSELRQLTTAVHAAEDTGADGTRSASGGHEIP